MEAHPMARITHRVRQAGLYFVTTDTWQRRTLFAKPAAAKIVLEQLLNCRDRGFYKLPVAARMVQKPQDYLMSSASGGYVLDPSYFD